MTEVTMVGNLTATPELKFIPNGAARATFTIAVSQRVKQGGEYVDAPPDVSAGHCVAGTRRAHS
jgi:single-strand DNA-binding protein